MKLPPNTCPMIDRLKKAIEEAHTLALIECESENFDDLQITLRRIEHLLWGEAEVLEDIRNANSLLREAAEYYRDVLERMEQ